MNSKRNFVPPKPPPWPWQRPRLFAAMVVLSLPVFWAMWMAWRG